MAKETRCWWAGDDPLYVAYHDEEWGVPVHDDRRLFEMLILEGAQAGLSWSTILRKREGYRRAFAGWELEAVARFGERAGQEEQSAVSPPGRDVLPLLTLDDGALRRVFLAELPDAVHHFTCLCRKQVVRWSLTMPTACMNA